MHFVWDERFWEETLLQVMFKKSMYISCTFFLSKTFDMDKGNNASSQKRISVIHIISLYRFGYLSLSPPNTYICCEKTISPYTHKCVWVCV